MPATLGLYILDIIISREKEHVRKITKEAREIFIHQTILQRTLFSAIFFQLLLRFNKTLFYSLKYKKEAPTMHLFYIPRSFRICLLIFLFSFFFAPRINPVLIRRVASQIFCKIYDRIPDSVSFLFFFFRVFEFKMENNVCRYSRDWFLIELSNEIRNSSECDQSCFTSQFLEIFRVYAHVKWAENYRDLKLNWHYMYPMFILERIFKNLLIKSWLISLSTWEDVCFLFLDINAKNHPSKHLIGWKGKKKI